MKYLIVIGGPTASGKTGLAIEVARHYQTEIISADSRQFYRELEIGNARPTAVELAAAPHHFIADRSVIEPLTAGRFAEEALQKLQTIHATNDYAVVVGGSGLYLRALCEGLDEFPNVLPAALARVAELASAQGIAGLQAALATEDPDYYAVVDLQNARRIERALKVCYSGKAPYSSYLGKRIARPFQSIYLQPDVDRPSLYECINARVDFMLAAGLADEARSLHPLRELPALQTVGYQEWWPHFAGEITEARAGELIQRNSRRYAKRQATWFRDYLRVSGLQEAAATVRNYII